MEKFSIRQTLKNVKVFITECVRETETKCMWTLYGDTLAYKFMYLTFKFLRWKILQGFLQT